MSLVIGFAGGLLLGLLFWWQAVVHEAELADEYLKLQRELMLTRRELLAMERRDVHGWPYLHDGTTEPASRN